jgi:type II restriction enzyme
MLPIKIDRPKDYFKNNIHKIVSDYHNKIMTNITETQNKMDSFINEHHLVYELFYDKKELKLMEKYHNRARILSTNAGRIFDTAVKFIITDVEGGKSEYINNPNQHPSRFEIDVINHDKKIAYEIKWRDAGTDGDHTNKEFRKVDLLVEQGYTPIRLTFFMPELERSLKSQTQIINYYGKYGKTYTQDKAFEYINQMADIDLLQILKDFKTF